MKKLLLTLAVVALSSAFAHAEDKGTEFKFGGEILQRWYMDNNPFALSSNGATEQSVLQRDQFHVNAISSDKMQAYINMLHYDVWGQGVPANVSPYNTAVTNAGTPNNTATAGVGNDVQINEAWMWWKVSDIFSARIGRQSAEYGDGAILSRNEWLATPYALDAVMGRFSWDFLDLDLGGGKLADAGLIPAASGTDQEVVMYGLLASFKNLPDFLKKVDVFVVQVNSDLANGGVFIPQATKGAPAGGYGLTTYGLHLKGDVAIVDYRADAAFQSGKQTNGGGAGTDANWKGNMFDVEVGANFPEFMKGRVFVGYHMDSGDDSTTTDQEQYQPLFYDRHGHTGSMDVFGWGNLTDLHVGLTLNPMEDTTVGADWWSYSRTTDKAGATILDEQHLNFFPVGTLTTGTDKALGSEIDVWAKHNYGHGFSLLANAGFLSLGNYFKPAGASIGSPWQLLIQGKYAF